MEIPERDFGLRRKVPGEGPITRRVRLAGAPREGRLHGQWRVPRSLGGGVLGMIVLVLFFSNFAHDRLQFFLALTAIVAFFGLVVWALAMTPIRASFEQRWRPHRKIPPLETAPWKALADELGARYREGKLPRIDGGLSGVAFRLAFYRKRGARTVAVAVLPVAAGSALVAFPHLAEYRTKWDRDTGDPEFDRAWHVISKDAATAARTLGPAARRWIERAEPREVRAEGRFATISFTGFASDPGRIRAMVLAVVAMAGGEVPER